jgi:hypothetical protein
MKHFISTRPPHRPHIRPYSGISTRQKAVPELHSSAYHDGFDDYFGVLGRLSRESARVAAYVMIITSLLKLR